MALSRCLSESWDSRSCFFLFRFLECRRRHRAGELERHGRLRLGLVVDAVHDTEEIVVKPLGKELKSVVGFAGATILGDGRVSLILDVLGVAQMSKVLTEGQRTRASEGRDAQGEDVSQADSLLVVKSAGSTNFGLQLAQVDRLEEVNADSLQHAGGRDAIHYRGTILPLVYLSDLVEPRVPSLDSATLQIVVVKHQGRTYGVVVEEVLDIVDERFELAGTPRRLVLPARVVRSVRAAQQHPAELEHDEEGRRLGRRRLRRVPRRLRAGQQATCLGDLLHRALRGARGEPAARRAVAGVPRVHEAPRRINDPWPVSELQHTFPLQVSPFAGVLPGGQVH